MHRRPQIAIVTVGAFSVSADSAYLGIRALCHAAQKGSWHCFQKAVDGERDAGLRRAISRRQGLQ